ncbi:MAG: Hint domain-containing protein [Paracoccaceae bacterium]
MTEGGATGFGMRMSYLKKIKVTDAGLNEFPGGIGLGANIRTPCGPRRVELVRPGDLIVTRDNGLQPVRMIWTREISSVDISLNPALAPIALCPRAIGPMMPQHKLTVASDHHVLVPGYRLLGQEDTSCCLVQAHEVAGSSDDAYADTSAGITSFYTFVFDTHQVFACNGLPVESFLAGASEIAGLKKSHRDDLIRLFPQLKREPNSYPPIEYKPITQAEFLT